MNDKDHNTEIILEFRSTRLLGRYNQINFESWFHLLVLLSITHLIHGSKGRFNSLLVHYFEVHGIDFRSMDSDDFVAICQEYLPTLIDKIFSLYLSERHGASQQLDKLDAHQFTLGQSVRFTSLKLNCLSRKQWMNKIVALLSHLISLTHLNLAYYSLTEGDCGYESTTVPAINVFRFYHTTLIVIFTTLLHVRWVLLWLWS